MKKLKLLLAAAMVVTSGVAMAEMIEQLYNPVNYSDPSAGCAAANFVQYTGNVPWAIPPLQDGAYTFVGSRYISCSGGYLFASGEAYEGYLSNH